MPSRFSSEVRVSMPSSWPRSALASAVVRFSTFSMSEMESLPFTAASMLPLPRLLEAANHGIHAQLDAGEADRFFHELKLLPESLSEVRTSSRPARSSFSRFSTVTSSWLLAM